MGDEPTQDQLEEAAIRDLLARGYEVFRNTSDDCELRLLALHADQLLYIDTQAIRGGEIIVCQVGKPHHATRPRKNPITKM